MLIQEENEEISRERMINNMVNDAIYDLSFYYKISLPQDKVQKACEELVKSNKGISEVKEQIELMKISVIKNYEKKVLSEQIKAGLVPSNFGTIKKAIKSLSDDQELASKLCIYGGTIPYLITGEEPKRLIGDVDTYASIEDMKRIREIVKSDPNKYKVLSDTLASTGQEYGLEILVNDVEVSIFPTIDTQKGMIVKNFQEHTYANEMTLSQTLFHNLSLKELKTPHMIEGQSINITCPEFTYITKQASGREKDISDNLVLSKTVNPDKINLFAQKMNQKPEKIEQKTVKKETEKFGWKDSVEKAKYDLIKQKNELKAISNQVEKSANNNNQQNEKPKVKVKEDSKKSNNSNGFANALLLALITGFASGIIFTITFMMFS